LKVRVCVHCGIVQPKYTICTQDGLFMASHTVGGVVEKIKMTTEEIFDIFKGVRDDELYVLGMDPSRTHPRNLVLTVLPVLPPRSRPFLVTDGIICDDDLTITYGEILKLNNNLGSENLSESRKNKYTQSLIFRIKTLFDNTQGKAKHTNSRPMKGLKERFGGKDGQIRNNLMGKRVDFSARTVIGPDPTLRLNEIAVPPYIADILSYPEYVNHFNLKELQQLVWDDGANVVERDSVKFLLKYALEGDKRYRFFIRVGDIVHRKLRDGDRVLLNRQPTLHKGSMLAKRIIRREGKTIRMNLATTSTFNADFDGDEMNIYTASSELSKAELELLSATEHNMIGAQASKPVTSIVQDALLSCFLMTRDKVELSREDFFQICMEGDWDLQFIDHKLAHVERVYGEFGIDTPLYSGRTLFSFLLPDDFNYTQKNGALVEEPIVRIRRGVLIEGAINKVNLKSGHSSLILILHKEYSPSVSLEFVNNVQFIANAFMLYHGFSVGIADCIGTNTCDKDKSIREVITRCFIEADAHGSTCIDSYIREAKVNMALSKAKDVGMRIAKESLSEENNFISTVTSGSKGDYFNIAQIMGLLGQQNISGSRVIPQLNHQTRSLPHYPFTGMGADEEYESRGFIRHSFLTGLSPQEFWFHAMSGREGVTDTALKTAQSGYIQRKMVKIMEDIQVKYDQSVRNSVGSIIQFTYGGDNLCGTRTVLKHGIPRCCDIERIVDRANCRYENAHLHSQR
jgi:DNA-directed RNA polymerase II subunit RPB1